MKSRKVLSVTRFRNVILVLGSVLFLLPAPTQAQELPGLPDVPGLPSLPELPDLPNPGQLGENICNAAGGLCDWIGYALSLAEQLQGMMDTFHQEVTDMGDDLWGDATGWLEDSLSTLSMGVDSGVVKGAFADIERAIQQGPSALREATREAVSTLAKERYNGSDAPKNSPDGRFYEMSRTLPNVAAADVVTTMEQEQTAVVKAEAASVNETSYKLGAVAQQNTAATDTATAILAPGGNADALEDDVNTAVSTRAAIQALTEGVADTMRHDATFQSNLAESVKVLAQQQVMTNWELNLAVQTLTDAREKEIAEERAKMAMEVNGLYEEAEDLSGQFTDIVTAGAYLLTPDVSSLNPGALGW